MLHTTDSNNDCYDEIVNARDEHNKNTNRNIQAANVEHYRRIIGINKQCAKNSQATNEEYSRNTRGSSKIMLRIVKLRREMTEKRKYIYRYSRNITITQERSPSTNPDNSIEVIVWNTYISYI